MSDESWKEWEERRFRRGLVGIVLPLFAFSLLGCYVCGGLAGVLLILGIWVASVVITIGGITYLNWLLEE